MAKDVDLSSKQWIDIVFDGKNKDFGAYQLRADSVRRHTKATIIVLVAVIVIFGFMMAWLGGAFDKAEEDIIGSNEQDLAVLNESTEEEELEEEEEMLDMQEPEPEVEEIPEEEVTNSIQNTILDIVEDDKAINEVKTQEELRETNAAVGNVDVSDGVDDLTKTLVKNEVIVETVKEPEPEKEIVYTVANVQSPPMFVGGEQAMYKWLSEHINYPAAAAEEGIDGRVVVEFVVSKTGKIENARVVRGRHPALDKEALRVVNSMPAWQPGNNNGQAVKVTYNLPVTFKLQK